MAWTHLTADTCSYRNQLAQEVGSFAYIVDPVKYDHPRKSRVEFGIVAGNDVSIIGSKHMVDLESDLKGQTRLASKCPTLYYLNPPGATGATVKFMVVLSK